MKRLFPRTEPSWPLLCNARTHTHTRLSFIQIRGEFLPSDWPKLQQTQTEFSKHAMTSLESCCVFVLFSASVSHYVVCRDTWHLVLRSKQKTCDYRWKHSAPQCFYSPCKGRSGCVLLASRRTTNVINFINASFVQLWKGGSGSGITQGFKLFLDSLFLSPFPVP